MVGSMRITVLGCEEDPGDASSAISGLRFPRRTRQNPNQAPSSRCLLVESGETDPHATSYRPLYSKPMVLAATWEKAIREWFRDAECRSFGVVRSIAPDSPGRFAWRPGRMAAGGTRCLVLGVRPAFKLVQWHARQPRRPPGAPASPHADGGSASRFVVNGADQGT